MPYERNRVEIDLDNFVHNVEQLKSFLPKGIGFMQIVKADAYGHGAYEIAKKSISLGACYLGVANVEEGILLRTQNILSPILILSPCFVEEIDSIIDYNLTPSVSSYQFAVELNKKAKTKIHIEIDTGMGRTGLHYLTALTDIIRINNLPNIEIEGIFSHYSNSEKDVQFSSLQNQRFLEIVSSLDFEIKYIHIANSAGVITDYQQRGVQSQLANLVRLGLLTYGIYPDSSYEKLIDLKPVMSFKSFVCQINKALKGDSVGYNRTYIAVKDTTYAVIPVGYADGYDFLLSNAGKVSINNHLCPIIGRISMDMLCVDITDLANINVGDEVILIQGQELKAEKIVQLYQGLSYELLSQIGRRARRYYRENGKIISTSPLARRDFVSHDFTDKKLNLIIESAIGQRLQSKEIASLLYSEVLRRFFSDKDRDIHYRHKFEHTVTFSRLKNGFFEVETTLVFSKVLQQDYFFVACATRLEELEHYFRRRDVEYRWLLDNHFSLTDEYFEVNEVSVNDIALAVTSKKVNNALEIKCSHEQLANLVGKEVKFSISTKTYYPCNSSQLTIYITELTKGVKVSFKYPTRLLKNVEAVAIFAGRNRYPQIDQTSDNQIEVISEQDEWVFPNSGIVFTYSLNTV